MVAAILHNAAQAAEASWLHAALQSLKWLQQQLGDEAVPSELFQLHDEEMWFVFQEATHELHALLKKAERAHLLRIRTFLALRTLADDQAEIFRQMGWTLPEVEDEVEAECSVFRCDECERCFETAASLAVHQQRRHQQRAAVRRVTTDGVCRSCCKTFHTRPRLIHHLQHGLTRCWIFHLRKFKPMTIEQTNDKDEIDRREGTVLHRQGFQHVEKDQLWRWAEESELQPHLPLLDAESDFDDDPTESELAAWAQLGMLPAGQGGRTKTIRGHADLQLYNVAFETNRLEKKLHDQVGKWNKGPLWVPKPLADGRKFLLVLFSGHRRDFDVAQFTSWTSDLIPISIDLAIDRECGNILHDGMWRDLIRSRKVSGAHGAPPCETFSLARWIEADGVAPRPLRNMEQPWGVDHRNLREVEQVTIGNLLMVKTLYLLTMVFFFGGSVTMEHPAEIEEKAHKWTIWDSAFVHQLLTIVGFYKVRFLQGPLGRPFSKPTNLLVGRIQNMHQIIYSKYDPMWRPTEKLGGRHNGAWRTTWAKEYPPKLCQALAEGHVNHSRIVPTCGDEADPPGLQRFLDCLAKVYDPYFGDLEGTVMKSDYDRSAAFAISRPRLRHFTCTVLPRSAQLLSQVAQRAPDLPVEVSWRFDRHLKGEGVQVLKHGCTVRRVAEEELVVLGDAALPSEQGRCPYLEVHIDECGEGIGDQINDFGFGVTACDPEEISELGSVADEVPRSWVVDFTQSMVCLSVNNREASQGKRLSAAALKEGCRVGLLVKPTTFEIYIDGILRDTLPVRVEDRVPSNTGLYPVLDLYGRTIEISKTEAEEPITCLA
eukprot:s1027_g8.t1